MVFKGFAHGDLAALFGGIELQLHLLDVQQLLFELQAAFGDLVHKGLQLLAVAAGGVIQLDQFLALSQGKTDAFAAQIGSMRANEEVDALTTLGINPVDFLVLPRVLALLIVGPMLTAFGALVGMGVGWLVAVVIYGVTPLEYVYASVDSLTLPHVLVGLIKGTVYAVLVALAGCLQGMSAGRSAQAVGDATTASVVQAIVWIVVAASVLTVVFQRLDF